MAAVSQIMEILIPWVGRDMSAALCPAAERICVRFAGYTPRQDPEEIFRFVSGLIRFEVSRLTGGSFLVAPVPGMQVRMIPEDFDTIADDILFLLFSAFPTDGEHLRLLEDFAGETGSLSALRTIYVSFGALLPQGELATLRKVILGYPAFRLGWMRGGRDGDFPS